MTRNNESDATTSRGIERRRFLQLGTAASLTAALPAVSASSAPGLDAGPLRARSPQPGGLEPHAVIYDERFEAARRLAASVRSARIPTHPIRGDVTQLWYTWLSPLWKRSPLPIAGLTAYAAMFCLERLAWDQRLRMVRCTAGRLDCSFSGWLANPRGAAIADAYTAAADGPLHLWLIAPPAQLAALGTRAMGA